MFSAPCSRQGSHRVSALGARCVRDKSILLKHLTDQVMQDSWYSPDMTTPSPFYLSLFNSFVTLSAEVVETRRLLQQPLGFTVLGDRVQNLERFRKDLVVAKDKQSHLISVGWTAAGKMAISNSSRSSKCKARPDNFFYQGGHRGPLVSGLPKGL